jgi:hypothetical protein
VFSVVTSSFGFLVGDSLNAIFEAKHVKIDQQSDFLFAQFQVGQQLSLVDRLDFTDSFQFNDDPIVNWADSSNPGPKAVCTFIAASTICPVMSLASISWFPLSK